MRPPVALSIDATYTAYSWLTICASTASLPRSLILTSALADFVIIAQEHLIFRKGRWSNYEPEDYDKPSRLPVGAAALFAICCGIAGAVIGMSMWATAPSLLDYADCHTVLGG